MKRITNSITKTFIIDNIDQVKIFAIYLELEENVIRNCIITGKLIHSPIRVDPNASVGFKYNNKSILKMRDFGGFFWGDCFDLVAYVLTHKHGTIITTTNREHFKYILNRLAKEFGIDNGVANHESYINVISVIRKTKKLITFEPRSWNSIDDKYWINKYHKLFTIPFLSENYVYPVERFWIDSYNQPDPKYYYSAKDPCYAYYLGQDEDNISNIRLYFPARSNKDDKRPKFISNNNSFQGVLNVTGKYDYIVLCKSYKDALAMRRIFATLFVTGNLTALFIAYPSENYILTTNVIMFLYSKLNIPNPNRIINFVDFDRAGRLTAYRANREFGIPFVFLTNGELGLPNNNAKDITDFIEKYSPKEAVGLINYYIENYIINGRIEEEDSDGEDNPF